VTDVSESTEKTENINISYEDHSTCIISGCDKKLVTNVSESHYCPYHYDLYCKSPWCGGNRTDPHKEYCNSMCKVLYNTHWKLP
jgi:hypothetical protein